MSSKPSPLTSPAEETEDAAVVTGIDAVEAEAVGAVEAREIERGGKARSLAEHHIALARIGVPARIGARGADQDVVEAVAIDVPRRGDGLAAAVTGIDAVEAEAVGAVEAREIERRRQSPTPCRTPHSSRPHRSSRPDRRQRRRS